jgi:hypothetical protein
LKYGGVHYKAEKGDRQTMNKRQLKVDDFQQCISTREFIAAMALFSFGQASFSWIGNKADLDRILAERADIAVKQADALMLALREIPPKT